MSEVKQDGMADSFNEAPHQYSQTSRITREGAQLALCKQDNRRMALQHAICTRNRNSDASTILEEARLFESYLNGRPDASIEFTSVNEAVDQIAALWNPLAEIMGKYRTKTFSITDATEDKPIKLAIDISGLEKPKTTEQEKSLPTDQ